MNLFMYKPNFSNFQYLGNSTEGKIDEFVDFVTGLVEPKKRADISIRKFHKTVLTGSKIQALKKKTRKPTKKQSKRLTRSQFAKLGLYNLPTKSIKYIDLEPLHQLWLEYIKKQLQPFLKTCDDGSIVVPEVFEKNYEPFSKLLVKSDFHGAKITVVASCNPSLVNQTGIVAMETRNTFKIVSEDNKTRSEFIYHFISIIITIFMNNTHILFRLNIFTAIPKQDSVFKIRFDNIELKIFGKYLNIRPAERAVKKIKTIMRPDL